MLDSVVSVLVVSLHDVMVLIVVSRFLLIDGVIVPEVRIGGDLS